MTFMLAPVAGRLVDRFSSRPIHIIGGLLCSLGLILTSLAKTVNLFFLTYSLLFGLGAGSCRTSNFLIVTKYFVKRRSLATGIVTAGAGMGIFALAPLDQLLIDKLGLSGAYRLLGFVMLANCILSLPYNPNIEEEEISHGKSQETLDIPDDSPEIGVCTAKDSNKCRNLIDFSVWKVPVFAVSALCGAGIGIVSSTAQFYLVSTENFPDLCSVDVLRFL